MLDLGFKDELDGILEQLPEKRRTHLVSATFPHAVKALADRFQNDPMHVAGTAHGAAHADIEHVALKIGSRDHYAVLVNLLLLAGEERTLVFVRTREDTTALADKLAADGFLALPINGDLAQSQRTRTLQAFRRGAIHTLIATDVAARGLDISDVTTVVHVDPPIDSATYVHRSGRTGRAGQKGRSVMLVVKSRESRTRRLYWNAKVEAVWESPPGADEVAAHQLARAGERARAALELAGKVTAAHRDAAVHLLQDRDPVDVVAVLLGQAAVGVRAPFEVTGARVPAGPVAGVAVAAARSKSSPGAVTASAAEDVATVGAPAPVAAPGKPQPRVAAASVAPPQRPVASPANPQPRVAAAPETPPVASVPAVPPPPPIRRLPASQRGRPGSLPSWRRERGADEPRDAGPAVESTVVPSSSGFTRFRVNWGSRDGANASRVLGHVCRRGGIESHMVGAITVQFATTTFEVASGVVPSFLKRVKAPDRRDPHLVISVEGRKPVRSVGDHDASGES